jgi:hypothetical protein
MLLGRRRELLGRRCDSPPEPWPPRGGCHLVRKLEDSSALPQWQEDLKAVHRHVRARVEHTLARMKEWKILRD